MDSKFDAVIVGQGLAGTALAWSLRWQGARVLLVDRDQGITSSRVSAGLITPVTGQKMARSWRFPELWPYALRYYERVEAETGLRVFRGTSMVRLFTSTVERQQFDRCFLPEESRSDIQFLQSPVDPDSFDAPCAGFSMRDGGQLDVVTYLNVSREHFKRDGCFQICDLQFPWDVQFAAGGVRIPSLNVVADRIVLCQGFGGIGNHWFRDVEFKPSKGEILTLRVPGLREDRVIHRGIWLAPQGNELFRAGATYDWINLDAQPTAAGRDEIVARLKLFLRRPFEVVAHSAAVRPIHKNQYPVMGFHPLIPQLGFFNGLGSKGTLQAPFFSRQLASAMTGGERIDPEVDVSLKTDWTDPQARRIGHAAFHVKRSAAPLTTQAQEAVRSVVSPGEIVIDATTGNGYDTQFLAELVGPSGTIYAFDIQPIALQKTRSRLECSGILNVNLIQRCHSQMAEVVPREHHGLIAAVMFNLGYLPGADKQMTTTATTTSRAITWAITNLRRGGVVTIVAYTGHPGGADEADSVESLLRNLEEDCFEVRSVESQPGRTAGPRMFLVRRLDPGVLKPIVKD